MENYTGQEDERHQLQEDEEQARRRKGFAVYESTEGYIVRCEPLDVEAQEEGSEVEEKDGPEGEGDGKFEPVWTRLLYNIHPREMRLSKLDWYAVVRLGVVDICTGPH